MIKITRIAVQKNNKSRYNVFVDRGEGEQYAFSVSEDILVSSKLQKGMECDEEQLRFFIEKEEKHKAYQESLRYLSYRMRTVAEVRLHLKNKGIQKEWIEEIIARLKKQNWLNDGEFAAAFVRSKKNNSFHGPQKITHDLRLKGLSMATIERALAEYPNEEQVQQIVEWLQKQRRNPKISRQAFIMRLIARLQRRGFLKETIDQAIQKVSFEQDQTQEWEAIVHQGERIVRTYGQKYEGWEWEQRVKQALARRGFSFSLIQTYVDYIKEEGG